MRRNQYISLALIANLLRLHPNFIGSSLKTHGEDENFIQKQWIISKLGWSNHDFNKKIVLKPFLKPYNKFLPFFQLDSNVEEEKGWSSVQ